MKNDGINARNSSGQFLPGHPGGPGRMRRETEATYLKALRRGVKLKDWREVIARALTDAKNGDRHARRWLSDFLLGRPADASEILAAADAGPTEAPKVVLLDWRRHPQNSINSTNGEENGNN